MNYTNLHDINTLHCTDSNETLICGTNEEGQELTIVFNTIELLEWIDIDYMKKSALRYIENL